MLYNKVNYTKNKMQFFRNSSFFSLTVFLACLFFKTIKRNMMIALET